MGNYHQLMNILMCLLIILYKSTFNMWVTTQLKSTMQFPPDIMLFQDNQLAPKRPGENHKFSLSVPWI